MLEPICLSSKVLNLKPGPNVEPSLDFLRKRIWLCLCWGCIMLACSWQVLHSIFATWHKIGQIHAAAQQEENSCQAAWRQVLKGWVKCWCWLGDGDQAGLCGLCACSGIMLFALVSAKTIHWCVKQMSITSVECCSVSPLPQGWSTQRQMSYFWTNLWFFELCAPRHTCDTMYSVESS